MYTDVLPIHLYNVPCHHALSLHSCSYCQSYWLPSLSCFQLNIIRHIFDLRDLQFILQSIFHFLKSTKFLIYLRYSGFFVLNSQVLISSIVKEREKSRKLEILYTATNRENSELIKNNTPVSPVYFEIKCTFSADLLSEIRQSRFFDTQVSIWFIPIWINELHNPQDTTVRRYFKYQSLCWRLSCADCWLFSRGHF